MESLILNGKSENVTFYCFFKYVYPDLLETIRTIDLMITHILKCIETVSNYMVFFVL